MRQTEHLTSGGFAVPGSDSEAVDRGLAEFDRAQRDSLAVVRGAPRPARPLPTCAPPSTASTASPPSCRTPSCRRRAAAAAKRRRSARARGHGPADRGRPPRTRPADLAVDLRDELDVGEGARDGVETYLVGQEALWAGMQDLAKEDLETAERTGFPIVLLILLAVFGSLAAAALPLALGFASVAITGAVIFFLSQATEMSVFVTNVASMIGIGVAVDYSLFLLARYREEVRAGRRARGRTPHRHAHVRHRRAVLGHHRDRLAGRAVPGRLDHDPLDGHGRHRGGGGLDPGRGRPCCRR